MANSEGAANSKGDDQWQHVPAPQAVGIQTVQCAQEQINRRIIGDFARQQNQFNQDFMVPKMHEMQEMQEMQDMKMDKMQEMLEIQSEKIEKLSGEVQRLKANLRTRMSLEEIDSASDGRDLEEIGRELEEPLVCIFPKGAKFHKIGVGGCHIVSSKSEAEILRMSVRFQVAVQSGKEACKMCYPIPHIDLWDEANGGEGDLKFDAI